MDAPFCCNFNILFPKFHALDTPSSAMSTASIMLFNDRSIHRNCSQSILTIPFEGWLLQDVEQQSLISKKHRHYENVHAVKDYGNPLKYGMLQVNICAKK
ncbi:hypothetical protein H5410_016869 [Solanum commersonii]|uniref:Uncharacterized protein n=1 Tax=Solanum commersonii TaxID=4109 RepID=A0A9J5ZXG8_SOLCO|nr:hypothetical protein H5410_016869 [Solanum commersonii]